jgi:hypothetical protein
MVFNWHSMGIQWDLMGYDIGNCHVNRMMLMDNINLQGCERQNLLGL